MSLADEVGLDGLTMPALAHRLDCGVMTLYGYVDNKASLLEAIAQRGMQDLRMPRPLPTDAVGVLSAWGRALRETLLRHSALPAIFIDRPVVGPGILGGVEALAGALGRGGYGAKPGVHAIYAVLIYTIGFVNWEAPRTRGAAADSYARSWRSVAAGMGPERLPIVSTVIEELAKVAGEEQFEIGLAALTRGLGDSGSSASSSTGSDEPVRA